MLVRLLAFLSIGWCCLVKKKNENSIVIDVLAHKLVSEMKVLSEAEKVKVLEKFGINETQLPRMLATDPAVVALKAEPGNLIKIDRDDGTGKYSTYKIVR